MCLPCWRPLGTMRDNAMFLGFWFLLHVFFARFFLVYLGSCTSTWSHRRRLHASSDATTSNTSDFMSWLLFTFFFMWYPVSLASLWKKGTRTSPWIASCGTKRSSCGSCFLASCSFFACFFVFFVLAEAPTVGKAPVNVKAMPSMPPVSRWIHCRLFFVNCIIECFAWSFLQGCGCLASQDRYVGSCSLIYILIYFNVHCMFFCMIGFFIQDKEKKKAALNDRTRVPCFACIACVACFFDVSFFIPGIERVGQRSRQAQEGLPFFWMSVITKQKFSVRNCVLPGEGKYFYIECRVCQGVLLDMLFV